MKISVLGGGGLQNRPVGTPYNNVQAANTAGAIGQGLEQLGAGVNRAGDIVQGVNEDERRKEKEKTDNAQLFGAYGKLGEWKKKKLFDPVDGFLALKGEAAVGKGDKPLADEYLADFDKAADEIRKGLGNDDQLEAFNKLYQREQESAFHQMASHEAREHDVVREGKFRSAIEAALNNAASAPTDPEALNAAKTLGEGAVLIRGKDEGWSGEQTQAALRKFQTELHMGVLGRLTDMPGGAPLAKTYLEDHGDEIDQAARARSKVDEVIAKSDLKQRALATSQGILNIENPTERADAVAAIGDPELRDVVASHVAEESGRIERIRDQARNQLLGPVRLQVERSGGALDRSAKQFVQLDDAGQAEAEAYARRIRVSRGSSSVEDRRQQEAANKLVESRFRALSDADQLRVDLTKDPRFRGADETTLNLLAERQKKTEAIIKKGGLASLAEFRSQMAAKTYGLSKDDAALIRKKMIDWRLDHEEKVTPQEVALRLTDMVRTYVVKKGLIWDSTKKGYELTPEEAKRVGMDTNPAPDAPSPQPSAAVFQSSTGRRLPLAAVQQFVSEFKAKNSRPPRESEVLAHFGSNP